MTEIVRASLGLPTLPAGPQFRNSKLQHHPRKKIPNMFGSLKLGTRRQGGESGGPILEFEIYL